MVRGVCEGGLLAWRGIPYAAPPVGALRFAAPAAAVPWEGIRDASEYGAIAPQSFSNRLTRPPSMVLAAGEDCLTLNVHAPDSDSATPKSLPVMVFIHGGGYSAGSSRDFSGRGEGFVRSGRVVYVSFNYRLGALGYLDFSSFSTPERSFTSNLGLRDQLAALRWVRENISAFGGDPENVTVFGESAGGNAVTTLMATPPAHGLFARAIAQSPPPNAVYPPSLTARWAGEFVDILREVVIAHDGAGTDADGDVTRSTPQNLLSDASTSSLIAASVALQVRTPDEYPGSFCFAPVIDGDLLPERPLRAFRDGRAHRVPLIIGTNDREGSIFRGRVDILPRSPARIDALFDRAPAGSRQGMRDAYPGLPGRRAGADFGGDYGFWYPSTRVADFHSRYAPVWSYRFDVAPRLLELVGLDATHGVEMFALFDRTDEPLARVMTSLGGYEAYSAAGKRMRALWLRFAELGVPREDWPRYDERSRWTLVIDDEDRIESDPRRARRRAWHRFIPALAG
ncbi:MAG: carboxylesterase/lipase family protein [Actinomycetota bacterium]|nr:carboxylesterase/lipase family protein [Actinomycetota bacterium]